MRGRAGGREQARRRFHSSEQESGRGTRSCSSPELMGEVADRPLSSCVAACAGRGKERPPAGHGHLPPIGTSLQHPASSVLPPERERERGGWRQRRNGREQTEMGGDGSSCRTRQRRREMKTHARATRVRGTWVAWCTWAGTDHFLLLLSFSFSFFLSFFLYHLYTPLS